MFLDTNFNSALTVLINVHQNFIETAMKIYRYARCLPAPKQPRTSFLISKSASFCYDGLFLGHALIALCEHLETIEDLIELGFMLIKSKAKSQKVPNFSCGVTRAQVKWWVPLFYPFRGTFDLL